MEKYGSARAGQARAMANDSRLDWPASGSDAVTVPTTVDSTTGALGRLVASLMDSACAVTMGGSFSSSRSTRTVAMHDRPGPSLSVTSAVSVLPSGSS